MPQTHESSAAKDDLSAIVGRFHAWAARQTPEPSRSGVREISYEEALSARRSPRRPYAPLSETIAAQAVADAAAAKSATLAPVNADPVKSAPANDPAPAPIPKTAAPDRLKPSHKSSAAAKVSSRRKQAKTPAAAAPAPPVASQSSPTITAPAASPLTSAAANLPPFHTVLSACLTPEPTLSPTSRLKPAAAVSSPGAQTAAPKAASSLTPGSFQSVVQSGQTATTLAEDKPGTVNTRSISINLRVSPTEHAQLKDGAAAAGLTLAAYVRQCTFEIESLRDRLAQTIHELKTTASPHHHAPQLHGSVQEERKYCQPGILARLKGLLFQNRLSLSA